MLGEGGLDHITGAFACMHYHQRVGWVLWDNLAKLVYWPNECTVLYSSVLLYVNKNETLCTIGGVQ